MHCDLVRVADLAAIRTNKKHVLSFIDLQNFTKTKASLSHKPQSLHHAPEKQINLFLPAPKISTINKVVGLLFPASIGSVQFEVPQEVVGIFEVLSNSEDFMYKVFNADYAIFACDNYLKIYKDINLR